jgi:hypothetical protein
MCDVPPTEIPNQPRFQTYSRPTQVSVPHAANRKLTPMLPRCKVYMLQTKRSPLSKEDPEKSSNPMAWAVGSPEALPMHAYSTCLLATEQVDYCSGAFLPA